MGILIYIFFCRTNNTLPKMYYFNFIFKLGGWFFVGLCKIYHLYVLFQELELK